MDNAEFDNDGFKNYDVAFYSDDRRYIVAGYSNHTVRIFDAESMANVGVLDITDSELTGFGYYDSLGGYVLNTLVYSYILDKDFKLVYCSDLILSEEDGDIITGYMYSENYRFTAVGYNELIAMADEYLGDYVPTAEIREKYSIR